MNLQQDNILLSYRVSELERHQGITLEQLKSKKIKRLKEIAEDVRLQRQTISDFQGFVSWMSANLAGYDKYIQAGSYAALFARVLPIPYAGQASIFTKFVTQFTLALNSASLAINNHLVSSRKFIEMTDAIDPTKPLDPKTVSDAASFADNQLLRDMTDAQQKLATVADLSSGALSFLESLNHYMSGGDEYWNKAKGLFKKNVDPKEKSFITESCSNLRLQASRFNSNLKKYEELGKKQTTGIKSLQLFDELTAELSVR